MRYNNNMEPKIPKVRSGLSPELADSLKYRDSLLLNKQLELLKELDSPPAAWAEAIGTRLQIRDFLVQQKANLAKLHSNEEPNLRQNVANYLYALDTSLTGLTGDYGQDRAPETAQQLKENRIDRLMREPSNSLLELAIGFSAQDSDKVLSAGSLVARTIDIRNGVVERLWSPALSYTEGDIQIAHEELDTEILTVNSNFDRQISTILLWDESA